MVAGPNHNVFCDSPQPLKAGINVATVSQVLIVWLFCCLDGCSYFLRAVGHN